MKRVREQLSVSVGGETLVLLPEKVVYWPGRKAILLSDVHLGKAGHFRKHGIAVPSAIHFADLNKISGIIKEYGIERVYFLGDLFHSDLNSEWRIFNQWIHGFEEVLFFLIKGNHDILPGSLYGNANLIVENELEAGPFWFTHEKDIQDDLYNISGHIHPCVRLQGLARQAVKLPCFYFGEKYGLLPAFGEFTGFHPIKVYENDRVFAIADGQIISLTN